MLDCPIELWEIYGDICSKISEKNHGKIAGRPSEDSYGVIPETIRARLSRKYLLTFSRGI